MCIYKLRKGWRVIPSRATGAEEDSFSLFSRGCFSLFFFSFFFFLSFVLLSTKTEDSEERRRRRRRRMKEEIGAKEQQVQVPGMERLLLHSQDIQDVAPAGWPRSATCSLDRASLLFSELRGRRRPYRGHQSSRIAFLVHHAALNLGTNRPGGPHYSSLHGHS